MGNQRRLWIEEDSLSKAKSQENDMNSYHAIFEKYSAQPTLSPLDVLILKGLVVGQEFILSCLLLASHRLALSEESFATSNRKALNLSSDGRTSILFATWSLFILLAAIYGKPTKKSEGISKQQKFWSRCTDAIFMAILLRFLASVLRTLTASYSSDTVHALAIASLLLHLLACDYNYANGWADPITSLDARKRPAFHGGTLSLTAVFFSTTLLASRLEDNASVYLFVSYSVVLFALYPATRHQVAMNTHIANRVVPVFMTGLLILITFSLLQPNEMVFAATIFVLFSGLVPLWIFVLQNSKAQLRGPWDIAHVS